MFVLIVGLVDSISNISSSNRINAGLPNLYGRLGNDHFVNAETQFLCDVAAMATDSSLWEIFLSGSSKIKGIGNGSVSYINAPIGLIFDASKYNAIYGNSSTVRPLSQKTNFLIKFK